MVLDVVPSQGLMLLPRCASSSCLYLRHARAGGPESNAVPERPPLLSCGVQRHRSHCETGAPNIAL